MLLSSQFKFRDMMPVVDVRPITALPSVVALQGTESAIIQSMLAAMADTWRSNGLHVAGVVEDIQPGLPKACGGASLRNLGSGASYSLYQDLGPHSTACCLDAAGVAEACHDVVGDIEQCDIVVLSKFGKLEADRGGLLQAFIDAAAMNKPVLTSVSPMFTASYLSFVGEFGAVFPADEDVVSSWVRRALSQPRTAHEQETRP